ncbi:hypothetical protein REPUB_Repub02eG0066100 [Reevesia pubescens]
MERAARAAAKLHVGEIRTKKFATCKKEPNPLIEDLHHAVTSLSAELYTKDVHFLMELIQNAEDNEYLAGVQPSLEFVLTTRDITRTGAPSTLLVFNNEVGFSRKNMDSICSVGIGFKSVFLVSTQPHIFSNGYQEFEVKPESRVSTRNDVEKWIVSLAFPFGERLKRGTSSIGIFAFLPTAMVTNFPFIIQADFILASSRETIFLENKWNMGILGCVPSAFFNALSFCVKKGSPLSTVAQAIEFLPAQASSIPG